MPAILPPCKLLEFDLAGVEAVDLGWFCARLTGDPMVIRFAKLGLHALVTSHVVKQPVDTSLPDEVLAERFAHFKKSYKVATDGKTMGPYEYSKRVVHGTGYGLTPEGMTLMFPEVFPTAAAAKKVQDVYFQVCPPVPAFQKWVKVQMASKNKLGGPVRPGQTILTDLVAHPYGYAHEFFNVVEYRKLSPKQAAAMRRDPARREHVVEIEGIPHARKWGPDSKRGLAFYPQSTAAGQLCEMEQELFVDPDEPNYIGDFYYGRTPLRAPIHDSLFIECPFRKVDRLAERVFAAMMRPIEEMPLDPAWGMGAYLTIGVDGKIGDNWEDMEPIAAPTLAGDTMMTPAEESDEEEVLELRTEAATQPAA